MTSCLSKSWTAPDPAARTTSTTSPPRQSKPRTRGVTGTCTRLSFQNGPIAEVGTNGVTHEALLAILVDRLQGFQNGPYKCRENAIALTHLEDAQMWLQKRTRDRMARGVEGTMKI
jgi:hypothetical protein